MSVTSPENSTRTVSSPLNSYELWHLTWSNQPTQSPSIHPLSYLPGCETGGAHEMTTGLNLHILVILGTDLTQLESGAHLTVQLILLLRGTKWENYELSVQSNIIRSWHHLRSFRKKSLERSGAKLKWGGVFLVSVLCLSKMSLVINTLTKPWDDL